MRRVQSDSRVVYSYEGEYQEEQHTHFRTGVREEECEEEEERASVEEELRILRTFVRQDIVPSFKEHHGEGTRHFAVLLLLDKPLSSLAEDWHYRPLMSHGRPYVDPRFSTQPPRELYGNYVVAHPELCRPYRILRGIFFNTLPKYKYYYDHAEEMLFEEFDALQSAFERGQGQKVKFVILFSWLFPCDRCTDKVIKKFGAEFRRANPNIQRVIVVFALYWRRIPLEQNWRNFKRLKESGFDIVLAKCE